MRDETQQDQLPSSLGGGCVARLLVCDVFYIESRGGKEDGGEEEGGRGNMG